MKILPLQNLNKKFNQNKAVKAAVFKGTEAAGDTFEGGSSIKRDSGIAVSALKFLGFLPSAKKSAPHIDFTPAGTIEEGLKFGRKNLGIKKYEGFNDEDLDVLNWINEGLVNVNNMSEGSAVMPARISYIEWKALAGAGMTLKGRLIINKSVMNYIKEKAQADRRCVSFKEIMQERAEKIKENPEEEFEYTSAFSSIYHEAGHLQHHNNLGITYIFLLLLCNQDKEYGRIYGREALKLKKIFDNSLDTAGKVSEYAQRSPLEFIAECYSKMIDGIKLDDDVLHLYKKLGGAVLKYK